MRNEEGARRRVNGLEQPWHPLQIATWVILPLLVVYFYVFLIPLLQSVAFVVVASIVFGFATLVALFAGYRTCAIDPVDKFVLQTQEGPREKVFCYLCSTFVQKESRHCILCRKCIDNFDHHCKWLNTCIGRHNYRYFLTVVASVAVQTTLAFAITVLLLVRYFATSDDFRSAVNESDVVATNGFASMVILFVAGTLLLGLVALVWQLLCFHIMLVSRGQTTYEFIMNQHKKQQERQRQRRDKTPTSTNHNNSNNNSPASAQPRTGSRVSDEEAPSAEMKTYRGDKATRVEAKAASAAVAAEEENGTNKDSDAQAGSNNDV